MDKVREIFLRREGKRTADGGTGIYNDFQESGGRHEETYSRGTFDMPLATKVFAMRLRLP